MARLKIGFIPIEGGRFYGEALEEVIRAEELGFDSVWMEEHHGVRDHYWPSPLTVLAGFATRTSRVLLGTDIPVFPFYHPVRLAEDAALLDVMSRGRFILAAAIGYKPDEFALYGVPLEKRGARFEEGVKLLKALWTEERATFRGRDYRVENARIEPKPVSKPHPPIWIGRWGDLALERAATLAQKWIPGRPLRSIGSWMENAASSSIVPPPVSPTPSRSGSLLCAKSAGAVPCSDKSSASRRGARRTSSSSKISRGRPRDRRSGAPSPPTMRRPSCTPPARPVLPRGPS